MRVIQIFRLNLLKSNFVSVTDGAYPSQMEDQIEGYYSKLV